MGIANHVVPSPGTRCFGWLPGFFRKAAVGDTPSAARRDALGQVIADLELLNRTTERDFLQIGGKLSEFIEAVDLISTDLTNLMSMMSPEQSQHASHGLTCILDRFTKIRARGAEGSGLLDGMLREAGQAKQTLTTFQGTVTVLTTLGVLTRIETARLGSAGGDFEPLADHVKSLSGDVQQRVETALETANQLIPPIETTLHDAAALERRETGDLPSMISGVLAQLAAFSGIQKRANESSLRMRSRYGAISEAFKKLVVSLQFQDITRQQVEHAIEILRRLRSNVEGEDHGAVGHSRETAAVLTLQSAQLAAAGDKFAASVATIAGSLDDIAAHVLEMAGESQTLSGLSDAEKDPFFLQMEQACSAILARLVRCAESEATNQATHRDLAETIGRMRAAIEKIQDVEIQMTRLALNASVRAAHIGDSGNALAVLAGAIQQLAVESAGRSDSVVRELDSMSRASARLSERCLSANSSPCKETMRAAIAEIHSSNERSFAAMGQIVVRATRLREDLSTARAGFSVGPLFADAVRHARDILDEIATQSQPKFLAPDAVVGERSLDDFAQHYTMQAERDVHAGATQVASPALLATQLQPSDFPPTAVEEVEDNVEFF